ncbi:MAG: hypothetical protein ACXWJN_08790 [Methyloceanibacter sp.]
MRRLRLCLPVLLVLAGSAALRATAAETTPEERTAQKLDSVRTDPLALRTFLARMPKGADLHNHLDGAVYAETFLRVGGEDGLCIDQAAKAFTKAQPIEAGASPQPVCEAGDIPAADVPKSQTLYNALVDSFSMRGFVPSKGATGHDHFFATFSKFGGTDPRHTGEFLDEVATRAAAQNEQYLELMETPTWNRLNTITNGVNWHRGFARRPRLLGSSRIHPQRARALRHAGRVSRLQGSDPLHLSGVPQHAERARFRPDLVRI